MFGFFGKKDKKESPLSSEASPQSASDVLPEEVMQFLRLRDEINAPDLRIHILNEQSSSEMTSYLQRSSACKRLGLYALDDANDSNPYCYISHGVAAGMVVHFNHDPEPRIEFTSLGEFENFLRELRSTDTALGEVDVETPAHPNQIELATALSDLASTNDEDSEFLLCLYLPLLRCDSGQVLRELSQSESFFVREAVAEAIGAAGLTNSEAVIRMLTADPHPQVRSAAARALKRLKIAYRDA